LEQFPSFIDGHIQYWKYLKFRLNRISGRMGQVSYKKPDPEAASKVKEGSGKLLLDKMREVAELALAQSDNTEVPTSLWVEARTIYAKQMIYDRKLREAIDILRDVCFILPPMTSIKGLSFVDVDN